MKDFLILIWIVILLLGGVYAGQIFIFIHGLSRLRRGTGTRRYTVNVIVAARNEEHHIEKSVRALLAQDYPRDLYSIIVVDDQSTDRTAEIVDEFARKYPNVRLLKIQNRPHDVSPIINATNEAISQSSAEVILTTDADSAVGPGWISGMVRHFHENVGVISGLTLFEDVRSIPRLLFGFQFIDFFSNTACGAGSIGIGAPMNCNGSNMGFRRQAFDDVGGYGSIAQLNSGSDSLLAQKIAATKRWKMRFAFEPETHVLTLPVTSWAQLLHQRMRWAGQTSHYQRFSTMLFLVTSFLLYLLLLLFTPVSLFYFSIVPVPIVVLLLKFCVDYLIISKFLKLTKVRGLRKYFLVSEIIHVPVILTAVFGSFFGSYEWKGRRMEREISQHA